MKRIAILVAAISSSVSMAQAQEELVCMPTPELEAALIDWYGETLVSQENSFTYVWASGVGGTWTLVTYEPDGTSCTLAHGQNWHPKLDTDLLLARLDLTEG